MTLETQVSENIGSFAFATNHSGFKKNTWKIMAKQ